jgi:hypothetical protein
MIDWTKLKIADIKDLIIEQGLFTREEVDNLEYKGKSEWVDFAKNLLTVTDPLAMVENDDSGARFHFEELEDTISNMVKEVEVDAEKKEVQPATPRYCDPEWQDYVLSQFDPKELVDGKFPSVNGLRRVVDLLLGDVIESGTVGLNTTMDPGGLAKAVATYEISIAWKLDMGPYVDLLSGKDFPVRKFRAVASSYPMNTDDMYAVFPEAIAEVRAEGRALRKALRLAVVCADEITRKNTAEIVKQTLAKADKPTGGDWDEGALISDNQINTIKLMCERLGVDVTKFINSGSKQYKDIVDISRQTAANMIKKLNAYQGSGNGSLEIPFEILLEKKV